MKRAFWVLLILALANLRAYAITETFPFNGVNVAVPDGNPSGAANVQTVSSQVDSISSIVVSVSISGTPAPAFNGDLYAYLQHGSGLSVLLNRLGRTSSNSFGYDDNGLTVSLSDAAAKDIHLYQDVVVPAAGAPLTGLWQPDGRTIDPDFALDTSSRNAPLSVFNGLDPDGSWTLFVADMSTGAEHTLGSWSLEITGVPESGAGILLGSALMLLALSRRGRGLPLSP